MRKLALSEMKIGQVFHKEFTILYNDNNIKKEATTFRLIEVDTELDDTPTYWLKQLSGRSIYVTVDFTRHAGLIPLGDTIFTVKRVKK